MQTLIGKLDSIEYVDEIKLEFMIKSNELEIAKRAILDNHPYETPVFDFIKMNKESEYGLGIIGQLNKTMTLDEFSEYAKNNSVYQAYDIQVNMIVQLRK